MRFAVVEFLGGAGGDPSFLFAPEHDSSTVEEAPAELSTQLQYLVHEYPHMGLGFGLDEGKGKALCTDGH